MRIRIQPEKGETWPEIVHEQVFEMVLIGRRVNEVGAAANFIHEMTLAPPQTAATLPDLIGRLHAEILRLERDYMRGSREMEREIQRKHEEVAKAKAAAESVTDGGDAPTT